MSDVRESFFKERLSCVCLRRLMCSSGPIDERGINFDVLLSHLDGRSYNPESNFDDVSSLFSEIILSCFDFLEYLRNFLDFYQTIR